MNGGVATAVERRDLQTGERHVMPEPACGAVPSRSQSVRDVIMASAPTAASQERCESSGCSVLGKRSVRDVLSG